MTAPMRSGSPCFSVVIPAYNAAATLERSLQSVLAQTWPAHEIIVVDDGSQDGTAEVVARRPGVTYIRQDNAGPSAARNRGVQAASGDWIAFLDADDWFYPQRLQVHAEMVMADPGLDFLVAGYDFADSSGRVIEPSIDRTALGRQLLQRVGRSGHAVIDTADIGAFVANQFSDTRGLSLPRQRFLDLGGFPRELRICEDLVFLIRLAMASQRAGVACASLAVYVVHDGGLIRSDTLRAQTETVRALHTLDGAMGQATAVLRGVWQQLLKEAYRDLAQVLARQRGRRAALAALLRSWRFSPAWRDGRDMLSVLKG